VLADPQTQTRAETGNFNGETVPDVQALLKSRAGVPTFGVGGGDLMWDDLSLFPEYERGVTAMGVPFFQVIGNHDLDLLGRSDETSSRTFIDRFGPTYYSFNVGAIHYVVLDDVMWHGTGYIGYVDERQLQWLEADLSQVERGRTVIVFTHIPLLCTQHRRQKQSAPSVSQVVTNRLAIYRLLEGYKAHVMTGHTHENEHVLEQGVHEHIHGRGLRRVVDRPGLFRRHAEGLRRLRSPRRGAALALQVDGATVDASVAGLRARQRSPAARRADRERLELRSEVAGRLV
jgi:hypothetical protein